MHCKFQTERLNSPKHGIPHLSILRSTVQFPNVLQIADRIETWIREDRASLHRITVTGFHGLLWADRDPSMHRVLNSADMWVPDGIAPVWIARLKGFRNTVRTPGREILLEYMNRANERGYRSFFYGETEETLEALRHSLDRKFPRHSIAGMISPPFRKLSEDEDREVIGKINAARPDVLWVSLGMPKQEFWIYERRKSLKVPVAIGIGAALSFLSGTVKSCPDWIGRAGLEWAYRVAMEPRKLWRRDVIEGPDFIRRVLVESLGISQRNAKAMQEEEV